MELWEFNKMTYIIDVLANSQAASNQKPLPPGRLSGHGVFSWLAAPTSLKASFSALPLEPWVPDVFSFWHCQFYHNTVVAVADSENTRFCSCCCCALRAALSGGWIMNISTRKEAWFSSRLWTLEFWAHWSWGLSLAMWRGCLWEEDWLVMWPPNTRIH